MRGLYTLGVRLYKFIIILASPFNPKAKLWLQGRNESWKKINQINWISEQIYWFHCASLGEFEQGRPLLERIKKEQPSSQILVTFFSPSGYEIKKNYPLADCICYLPIDTKKNARKLFQNIPISKAFFVKYEFWGNYILEGKKSGIEIYSLATILRPDQHFFKPWGGYFRKILNAITHFYIQNEQTKDLLQSISISNSTVIGDPRFDRVSENASKVKPNPIFEAFKTKRTLAIGSSWEIDEALLFPIMNNESFEDLVIIAPHEIHENHIQSIENALNKPYQLYTDIEKGEQLNDNTQVIIVNCIGILADTYQYGDYAYVGGAFGSGLHNILEPCVFGLPVTFGPKHSKFPEAQQFIDAGIGKSISTQEELQDAFSYFTSHLSESKMNCQSLVAQNVGATDLMMKDLGLK